MANLTLYTNPQSRGQIAHWMVEELGVPYETRWMSFGPQGHKSPEYLALNPMGKLPTIVHDGNVVTEAAAICLYLADVYPEAALGPRPEERADYYRWTLFAAGPIEHAVTNRALSLDPPAERAGTIGYGSYDQAVGVLERHLDGRTYVCGDRFTAADVYVGSAVSWGVMFKTLPERPAFVRYAERMSAREALIRCRKLNDEQRAKSS